MPSWAFPCADELECLMEGIPTAMLGLSLWSRVFQVVLVVKNLPPNAEDIIDVGLIPRSYYLE